MEPVEEQTSPRNGPENPGIQKRALKGEETFEDDIDVELTGIELLDQETKVAYDLMRIPMGKR